MRGWKRWKCFPTGSVIPVIGKIRIAGEWGTLVTSGPLQISTVEEVLSLKLY